MPPNKSKRPQPPAPTPPPADAPPAARPNGFFKTKTARQAVAMRKHVQKLLNHQRDILSPQALEGIQTATQNLQAALDSRADDATLDKLMKALEDTANKWFKHYPNPGLR